MLFKHWKSLEQQILWYTIGQFPSILYKRRCKYKFREINYLFCNYEQRMVRLLIIENYKWTKSVDGFDNILKLRILSMGNYPSFCIPMKNNMIRWYFKCTRGYQKEIKIINLYYPPPPPSNLLFHSGLKLLHLPQTMLSLWRSQYVNTWLLTYRNPLESFIGLQSHSLLIALNEKFILITILRHVAFR